MPKLFFGRSSLAIGSVVQRVPFPFGRVDRQATWQAQRAFLRVEAAADSKLGSFFAK
jgi:hypothetical protein